jgi:hypothetical protein
MNSINPDALHRGDCIQQAIEYVRWRIPNMMNHKVKKTEEHAAAWFFQTKIPMRRGVVESKPSGYIEHGMKTQAHLLRKLEL